jgi:hypothetical protein
MSPVWVVAVGDLLPLQYLGDFSVSDALETGGRCLRALGAGKISAGNIESPMGDSILVFSNGFPMGVLIAHAEIVDHSRDGLLGEAGGQHVGVSPLL